MSVVQSSQLKGDPLDPIFYDLKSRLPEVRTQAAISLRRYVVTKGAEMPSDEAVKLWDGKITGKLSEMVHSTSPWEKLGALSAIDHLIDIDVKESIESKRNLIRFHNYTKSLLSLQPMDITVMQAASKLMGRIASLAGAAFGGNFMDYEVPAAIALLEVEKGESSRYAGVLILKELARNSPTYFQSHMDLVLEKIGYPLRDPKVLVREAAADALGACLAIVVKRERKRSPHMTTIQQDAHNGLRTSSRPEVIHGCLLTYKELFNAGGMFMKDCFTETAEEILRFKADKDPLVRRTVMSLIPVLAEYDTATFSDMLHRVMAYLLSQVQKPSERSSAFDAIGRTAKAVASEIKPFLEQIIQEIKAGLQTRGKKNAPAEEPLFTCIGMLAAAVGPSLTKLLHDMLDLMFHSGLTEPFCNALAQIAKHIPPLLRTVQDRLLELLSLILVGQSYKALGARGLGRAEYSSIGREVANGQVTGFSRTPQSINLALATLGSFDFSGHVLNEFVRTAALPYLEDDSPEIRRAAAQTCCQLFAKDPICHQTSTHAIEVLSDVLNKLLIVGIADPDPLTRQIVLQSMESPFDRHLAQAQNVRSLFIALNDEVFENRLLAVDLIGRMSLYNPAYVMPSLRKTLIQLLTELEYSTIVAHREHCTQLLTALIHATQKLIKPYALPMLKVLLTKANDPNPAVSANILKCLGELTAVGGSDILPHVPDLMQIINSRLNDPVQAKRDAALHTMAQVCSSTGYVVTPLIDYPQLLPAFQNILKGGPSAASRRELLKVLGIIGAVDPYRRKINFGDDLPDDQPVNEPAPATIPAPSTSSEDYYQSVAIASLLKILADINEQATHHQIIEAIMSMFKTGVKCIGFLPKIIPAFIETARNASARVQPYNLHQISVLITIIAAHIRNYTPQIFNLVTELWYHVNLQPGLVPLVESLSLALDSEIKPFLPTVLPLLLKSFEGDSSGHSPDVRGKILDVIVTFGTNVEEYLHLIIPIIVNCYDATSIVALQKKAVQTIDGLSRRVNLSDHASRIIHPMVRLLDRSGPEVRSSIMDTLCSLVGQLGPDFAIFVPTISKCLLRHKIHHSRYDALITRLLNGERLTQDLTLPGSQDDFLKRQEIAVPSEASKLQVNQQHLKEAWDVKSVATAAEWVGWMERISVEFMKESPSHALRACMTLVASHAQLAKELFNPAFFSCFSELYEGYQEDLVKSIEMALTAAETPLDVINRLLDLAEFMEHEDRPLPIENRVLGDCALRNHSYAKALHYKELDFMTDESAATIVSLIGIATRLQQHDAAWGMVVMGREQFGISEHEEWYERLGRWEEAKEAYERSVQNHPGSTEAEIGLLKCYHHLGEFDRLAVQVDQHWKNADADMRSRMAPMAAAAAWSLEEWADLEDYASAIREDCADRDFYLAVLSVRRSNYAAATQHIARTRTLLDPDLASLVGEGYRRSFATMVQAQMLSELEEVMTYKKNYADVERRQFMQETWMKRLRGCMPDVDAWQRILQVRSLVLEPEDDPMMWIKFANLCRKSDRIALAEKTIASLMHLDRNSREPIAHRRASPHVVYTQLKCMWANNNRSESLQYLRDFATDLQSDIVNHGGRLRSNGNVHREQNLSHLLARCYFKLGEWQMAEQDDWEARNISDILQCYKSATEYDPNWYKAFHSWALTNCEVIGYVESLQQQGQYNGTDKQITAYAVQAIQCFFKSIALCKDDALQDVLRLLTLWFKYGASDDIGYAVQAGFQTVDVDTWLEVIPQIIARIQTPSSSIRRNINMLLNDIGKRHPQALIYPLTVASKSSSDSRRSAALAIMERLREHSPTLVEQADLISGELIRVAILWHELWYEGLEEASRLYFTNKDPPGMFQVLEPLHNLLRQGPTTARETSFSQVFGRDLTEAQACCVRYRRSGASSELDSAWDIYYRVFRKIEKQLPQLTTLDLQFVSPKLLGSHHLELAVPGTYQAGNRPVISIDRFAHKLSVIPSKQRPRKFNLIGSDGKDYQYLLKGHEDLRQDERVMQLFSLCNTLLSADTDSYKRRLSIQRCAIIPLAPNVGLIGWHRDTDTLHVLVQDYRATRKVLIDIEWRLMQQMAPDFETLTLLQKMEVLEYALENTTGQDLYRVFWLKSRNSEHWLERRSTYTRSLAVNSMVGHILGLGDRHPSNIMINRITGKVINIDFGDCFEIAQKREKYPEKIPFRLTRMLTQAMEVSRVEGSFRNTCEITMRVLRSNDAAIGALLEAFIYDPLISWRLMQTEKLDVDRGDEEITERVAGVDVRGSTRRRTANENEIFDDEDAHAIGPAPQEVRNEKAVSVYERVQNKLTGRDFDSSVSLSVPAQVEKLIQQARSIENLCQCYRGWCPFW